MNNQSIIKALNLPNTKDANTYATKLNKIAAFIKDLKKLPGFSYELGEHTQKNIEISHEAYKRDLGMNVRYVDCVLLKDATLQNITLKHANGHYSINVPMNNDYYNYIMFLLDANFEAKTAETIYTHDILIDIAIKTYLRRAIPFISKDKLRPNLCGACIEFYPNNTLKLIATDAHRLYVSPAVNYSGPSITPGKQIIIPLDACKLFAAIKPASKAANVTSLKFNDTDFCISNITGVLIDGRFVPYLDVIPQTSPYQFELDKGKLMSAINVSMPFTNKTTTQINFSINGNLKISASDIDFSYEAGQSMDYIKSNTPDANFALNGKLLTEVLKSFTDSEHITFYTQGVTDKDSTSITRPFVIRGNNPAETVLLMPLYMGV
jgi:hypothetical protein